MVADEKSYPTDVSDEEWTLLELFFLPPGVPRKAGRVGTAESARSCYNAIRFLLKTGCQWRMLPSELPPKSTVHDALTRTADGLWPRLNEALRPALRLKLKKATPSAAIIDSQSVKCADTVATSSSGYDAGKKIKGRKRHLLTDTEGLLPGSSRRTGQRAGPGWREGPVLPVLPSVFERDPDLCRRRLSGKTGSLGAANGDPLRPPQPCPGNHQTQRSGQGLQLLPRRWVVERTFSWLMKSRRLTRDHERKPSHHEAFVYLAMIGFAFSTISQ